MQAARQAVFDFGPSDHFVTLHGGHRCPVAVATKDAGGEFRQYVYGHADAATMLLNLAGGDDQATYLSQSGFAAVGGRRTVGQVRALTCWFVDLDSYKVPGLSGADAAQLLDGSRRVHPWLPDPTLLVDSGRGAYFVWAFDRPVAVERLAEWQAVEDALVALLKPFGADPQARDAARILRVAGSFHLAAGERVQAQRVGDAVAFDRMRRLVLDHAPAKPAARRLHSIEGTGPAAKKRTGQALQGYQLALDRMADYRRLAELRGGDLGDYRHRLLYCYAQACAWYAGSEAQLRDELDDFAALHFRDPDRYRSRLVESVIDRFLEDGCGKIVRLSSTRDEGRYRFSNRYIIRTLGVTRDEQQQLRTIISTEEKLRRLTEKRRASGMASRAQYLDRAAERRSEARRLRADEGLSVREIAGRLGVSVGAVAGYLQA